MKPRLSHCGQNTRRFLRMPLVTCIFLPKGIWHLVSRTCHLAAIYCPGVTPESTAGFPLHGVSVSTLSQEAVMAGVETRHRCVLSSCCSSLKTAKVAFGHLRDLQGSSVLRRLEKPITQWMRSPQHLCSSGKVQNVRDPQRRPVWPGVCKPLSLPSLASSAGR